jgi:ABC-type Fe3+/spermidine/putrescine transport system ATPase subunit
VSSSDPLLRLDGLSAAWGGTPVLRSVDLDLAPQEYFVLLGPNGSGKSTLLRVIAGLEPPTGGRVLLGGEDVTRRPAHRRGIGLMFQDPALFPHRTVYENIAYGPLLQRRDRSQMEDDIARLVRLLGLAGFEDRPPGTLSGGERQRVALARTLAARPRLVLLDEPFASIDVELRSALRAEFRSVLRGLGIAAIHVTHDREEAMFLGDRVGLLFGGRLDAVGTPGAVYGNPSSPRVARFLGYNVFRAGDHEEAVDPADVRLDRAPPGLSLTVDAVGGVGRDWLAVLSDPEGTRFEARSRAGEPPPAVGARVYARWEGGHRL